ncbi:MULTISPECIES: hypothetical protein [Sutcliffiella]|uniref:Uncharacterized protein n=1 Tax=Sutcliffiella cohnii TaxID=33932 RepID=A0A223KS30_9BACI|nr:MULTISPECIES: hypothetical protein [Sutcliffiella]AST92301.1 hypothetical protein BC6307_13900 [Sutcliffiella cohnii]WBL13533.1 hypothetical protein O1A01_16620 [Sutcliffiella sp. NC1]
MIIKECRGFELEKAKPNTSEDFFNQSEITFIENGTEKKFNVLYVRYFEESFSQILSLGYENNPLFKVGDREVELKDIVALTCLIKNPSFKERKRLYINTKEDFASYFEQVNVQKLKEVIEAIELNGSYTVKSPLYFINEAVS